MTDEILSWQFYPNFQLIFLLIQWAYLATAQDLFRFPENRQKNVYVAANIRLEMNSK